MKGKRRHYSSNNAQILTLDRNENQLEIEIWDKNQQQ